MIFSSPVYPSELYGSKCPDSIKHVLLVGNDMVWYSIGYVFVYSKWQFVGIECCGWEIEDIREGFNAYLRS